MLHQIHTRAGGTAGEPIERWATTHGAATIDVTATAIDAAASDDEAAEAHDEPAGSGSAAADATKHDRDPPRGQPGSPEVE